MIEILNESGRLLKLYQNTVIENEINSWLISQDDNLWGSFSWPFSFPIQGNESFLGYKHRIEASVAKIPVTLSVNGLPIGAGLLSFTVKNKEASGNIEFASTAVTAKLRANYLHDAVIDQQWSLCRDPAELPSAMLKTVDPMDNPYPFVFFPVHNEEFTDPDHETKSAVYTYDHIKVVNSYSTLLGRFVTDTPTGIGYPAVPFFYFTWLLRKVCDFLGYTPEGIWLDNAGIKSLVLYNTMAINAQEGFFKTCLVMAKYHVWNMKLNDFFRVLRNDLGVGVFFDDHGGRMLFYSFVELASEGENLDISDSLLKGMEFKPVVSGGLRIVFANDGSDNYSKEQATTEPFVIGEGENEISLTVGTLPMIATKGSFLTQRLLLPVAKQRGMSLDERYKDMGMYSLEFPVRNAPAPMLLMYLGMQPGFSGKPYPYGSSLSQNAMKTAVAEFSLLPDAPDSYFNRFVRPFYEYKAFTKEVVFNFHLKLSQALRLKMFQRLLVGSAEHTKLPYLIRNFAYKLPAVDGKVRAEMIVWPLLPPPEGYVPKIQSTLIWVRGGLYLFPGGFYPQAVGAFTVKFELFAYSDASLIATTAKDITIYYTYQTRGFNGGSQTMVEETLQKSIVCPAGQSSVSLEVPLEFWTVDDPVYQYQNPNLYYAVLSSFRVLYSSSYLIIG